MQNSRSNNLKCSNRFCKEIPPHQATEDKKRNKNQYSYPSKSKKERKEKHFGYNGNRSYLLPVGGTEQTSTAPPSSGNELSTSRTKNQIELLPKSIGTDLTAPDQEETIILRQESK